MATMSKRTRRVLAYSPAVAIGLALIGAHGWLNRGLRDDAVALGGGGGLDAQVGVAGLAILLLTLLVYITNRAREHTSRVRPSSDQPLSDIDKPGWRIIAVGFAIGLGAAALASLYLPPEEMGAAGLIRMVRLLLFAGFIGAGLYMILHLVATTTSRATLSRGEQILALVLAFSAVFIGGLWIALEIEKVGRAVAQLTLGTVDWIGSGLCPRTTRTPAAACAMRPRDDIFPIAAAMLALYFVGIAILESRRWRLSFARTVLILSAILLAGFVLFETVRALVGHGGAEIVASGPARLVTFGAFAGGLVAYAALFSVWFSGSQQHALVEALCNAFGSTERFREMLQARLETYDLPDRRDSLENDVRAVVDRAEKNGWLQTLLVKARFSRPNDVRLKRIADRKGVGIAEPSLENVTLAVRRAEGSRAVVKSASEGLERLTRKFSTLDPDERRRREARVETQVCCIITPRNEGTGWLVGPDLVLTNYHVVQDLIGEGARVRPEDVICRFDYKGVNRGVEFGLAADRPIVDWSPYHATDEIDTEEVPPETHLDYALLRLAIAVGKLPLGTATADGFAPQDRPNARAEPGAPARGWISLHKAARRPRLVQKDIDEMRTQLYVVQHPFGQPLKLAVGSVLKLNANGTRIRHEATTERGSSGSPCFDFADLEPYALHHAGKHSRTLNLPYNQAVPIGRIIEALKAGGKVEAFWDQAPSEAEKPFR